MNILTSKLQSPKLLNALDRPRLHDLFSDICNKKIIIVTAGAGYGKTTLTAKALEKAETLVLWYQLDRFDMDFTVFMNYLISGAKSLVPKIFETISDIQDVTTTSKIARETFLLEIISEFEQNINEHMTIVLDDYYLIQKSNEINEVMEFILERLPVNLHFVVISRIEPPIRLSRLRVLQQLVDINEKQLEFSKDEIRKLYVQHFNMPLPDTNVAMLHEKSGGWAASLILFRYTLRNETPDDVEKKLQLLKGSHGHIFSYLEENIFERQAPEIQQFMLKTSLLSVVDTDLCDQMFGIINGHELMKQLENDHLMTFRVDTTKRLFAYHHLLRDFLQAKLQQLFSVDKLNKLRFNIAASLEKTNDFEAIDLYLEGGYFDDVVRLFEKVEIPLMMQGKLHYLQTCLSKIPDDVIDNNPHLQALEAKLYSLSGKSLESIQKLKSALKLFRKKNHKDGAVKCLVELGFQYYYTGNLKEAKLLLEQLLNEIDEQSPVFIMTMTFLILFTSILGEFEKSDAYTEQALDVFSNLTGYEKQAGVALIRLSQTHRFYYSGDFVKSQHLTETIYKTATRLNLDALFPLIYFQFSANCFFLGEYDKGCEYAKNGITASEKINIKDSQKAWIYHSWGQNSLGAGRLDDSLDYVRKSLEIFNEPGNRWGIASCYDLLHQISLARNKPAEAKEYILTALGTIEDYGLTIAEGILETSLAGVLVHMQQYKKALPLLKKSRKKIGNSSWQLFRNYLLEARCQQLCHKVEESATVLKKALYIAEEKGFEMYIAKEGEWIIPVLVKCYSSGIIKNQIKNVLNHFDNRARNILNKLQQHKDPDLSSSASALLEDLPPLPVPPVNVTLLGKFSVQINGCQVQDSAWKSSKAAMIFKYLAVNRNSGFIPKEALIELLWPEEDLSKTGKRFNVAMSTLRRILEPATVSAKATSLYIIKQNDGYRLKTGDGGCIDTDLFLTKIETAEKSNNKISHYLDAESLYKGDFLEETPYDEWCMSYRGDLKTTYQNLLVKIIEYYETEKNYNQCICYAEKYLKTDTFDEAMYRKLMLFYADIQKITAIIKTYKRCQKHLEELDCPLSNETIQLYETLTKQP